MSTKEAESLRPGHGPTLSMDSVASGIAGSTISFSAFPQPPSSTPSTPTRPDFSSIKSGRTVRRKLPPIPTSPSAASWSNQRSDTSESHSNASLSSSRPLKASNSSTASTPSRSSPSCTVSISQNLRGDVSPNPVTPPYASPFSAYDWHEGASSIDVDVAEDRLLSTSFITSLLQENGGGTPSVRTNNHRTSFASDAFSGISEMTYPPLSMHIGNGTTSSSSQTQPHPSHPTNASRPPPSSFNPIPRSVAGQTTSDDDSITLASNIDKPRLTVVRPANRSMGPNSGGVLGVASATSRTVAGVGHQNEVSDARGSGTSSGLEGALRGSSGLKSGYGSYCVESYGPMSPALPSTAGTQLNFLRNSATRDENPDSRRSVHSTKSSFISRISLPWKKRPKPLPPVPIIPHIPVAVENEHRAEEATMPLPDLVARAGALNGMLEKGYHPHRSLSSYYQIPGKDEGVSLSFSGYEDMEYRDGTYRSRKPYVQVTSPPPWEINSPHSPLVKKRLTITMKTMVIIVAAFFIVAAAAIGSAVGVWASQRKQHLPACSAGLTGQACDLNSTCACVNARCDQLAQSIVDLTSTMNLHFSANYTIAAVYNAIWSAQGTASCTSQALLVDVAPGLESSNSPNRTTWARSALLWNLVQSQDIADTARLQNFVKEAPWSKLSSPDGPVSDSTSSFSMTVSGFIFNFASQIVTQPSVSFVSNGQPTSDQISRVSSSASSTLDRMYSFALASSTQRQQALENYWNSVLGQHPEDLSYFLAAFSSASILMPFEATYDPNSQPITALWGSTTTSFPPPISCYPGLNASQVDLINALEESVFGLPGASRATNFDPSCFANRPTYGVLDVLRLRLPFVDSRTGVPMQAVALNRGVSPRAVVYSKEMLSALPGHSLSSTFAPFDVNPQAYGTLNHLNHVILDYFSAVPDLDVAIALVEHVLSNGVAPPTNSSRLFDSLDSIPTLEVALFGSILPADISEVRSSFSSPTGSLFFGSSDGAQMRNWVINGTGHSVVWSDTATAPLIARDSSSTDPIFNQIWNAAAEAISQNLPNVGVGNITSSLQSTGKMSSD